MNGAALARPLRLADPGPGVRAWRCELARDPAEVAELATLLAPAELERRERYSREDLRLRYVVGRATLRAILGACLDVAPQDVDIVRGRRGRPELAVRHASDLDFNVSHTRSTAIVGVTSGRRIGMDIEHGERALNVEGIARKFMTSREQEQLRALDDDARRRTLLLLWTCKEAMSKATGDALAAPFRDLDVDAGARRSLLAGPPPCDLDVDAGAHRSLLAGPPPYTPAHWLLHPVDVGGGFLATAALWSPPPQ